MPPIPRNLHFIWVGSVVPTEYARNFVSWALGNLHYETYLWTEPSHIRHTVKKLLPLFENTAPFHDIAGCRKSATPLGTTLTLRSYTETQHPIHINDYKKVPPLIDRGLLRREMKDWKNYGAASDILRIEILHFSGGIYMDFDTYERYDSLPHELIPPKGLLFLISHAAEDLIKNAVIASDKNNDMLSLLAQSIEHEYLPYYPKNEDGIRYTPPQTRKMLMELRDYRIFKEDNKDNPFADFYLGMGLEDLLKTPTFQRSGPQKIHQWISNYEHVARLTPELILLYDFEVQANCKLRWESDGSWLK
ncbi:MAG: hypothetical protein MI749_19460 [Desulfovibrionales bacterium]|nr:hypothetical protein [Desulfovibrionales bacterium]